MKALKVLMKDIKIELEGDPFFLDEEIDKNKPLIKPNRNCELASESVEEDVSISDEFCCVFKIRK